MKKPMTFELQYRQNEVVSGQRFLFMESGRLKLSLLSTALMMGVFLIPGIYLLFTKGWSAGMEPFYFLGIAAVLMTSLTSFGTYFMGPLLNFWMRPEWKLTFNVQLNETGIDISRKDGRKGAKFNLRWEQIQKVLETRETYTVIWGPNPQESFILPKRIFGDQLPAFGEMLKRKSSPIWKAQADRKAGRGSS